ncbi:lytic exoenzyme target recognition domain-containing protein [Streptococcus constellatus]|uniref:lytic exoenzyme target recognition domain-containing protein n=1 Tax=Streptococcus constellatus TaxID=76860 RepID=UPI00200157DE|nr:lytic exoenzyme target recognition domain-containing protein [Streptococcus constellatus]
MSRIESSIAEMRRLKAIPVYYDMDDRYGNDADRDGRIEYDCSSAVSKALGLSLNNNTETLKSNLPTIGYHQVYDGVDGSIDFERGDVVIWGPRDGSSSLGAFGHVMIMTSPTTMIHCNYGYDGIAETDYNQIWEINGRPRETVFRENGQALPETSPAPAPQSERKLKVYQVDDLQEVNGIWQVKCDYLAPVEFDWLDNGIACGDIDIVDANGNLLDDQETKVGSYFVINPSKVVSDNSGAYGSGNYYWRNITLAESGAIWLSTWSVDDLLYQ